MSASDPTTAETERTKSWQPYVGPREGIGWTDGDDVIYDDKPPGEIDQDAVDEFLTQLSEEDRQQAREALGLDESETAPTTADIAENTERRTDLYELSDEDAIIALQDAAYEYELNRRENVFWNTALKEQMDPDVIFELSEQIDLPFGTSNVMRTSFWSENIGFKTKVEVGETDVSIQFDNMDISQANLEEAFQEEHPEAFETLLNNEHTADMGLRMFAEWSGSSNSQGTEHVWAYVLEQGREGQMKTEDLSRSSYSLQLIEELRENEELMNAIDTYAEFNSELLRQIYGDEINVYRGLSYRDELRNANRQLDETGECDYDHQKVASWTTDPSTAMMFGRGTNAFVSQSIPVENAIGSHFSGAGLSEESEIVATPSDDEYEERDQIENIEDGTIISDKSWESDDRKAAFRIYWNKMLELQNKLDAEYDDASVLDDEKIREVMEAADVDEDIIETNVSKVACKNVSVTKTESDNQVHKAEWKPYLGDRGGVGWTNGERRTYDDEPPGEIDQQAVDEFLDQIESDAVREMVLEELGITEEDIQPDTGDNTPPRSSQTADDTDLFGKRPELYADMSREEVEEIADLYDFGADFVTEAFERRVDPDTVFSVYVDEFNTSYSEISVMTNDLNDGLTGEMSVDGASFEVDFSSGTQNLKEIEQAFSEAHPETYKKLEETDNTTPWARRETASGVAYQAWSGGSRHAGTQPLWAYATEQLDESDVNNPELKGHENNMEIEDYQENEEFLDAMDEFVEFHRKAMRQIFGEEVRLFRGNTSTEMENYLDNPEGEFPHRTIGSWTYDPAVAMDFGWSDGAGVAVKDVSIENIFGSFLTDAGFNGENEVIAGTGAVDYDIAQSADEIESKTVMDSGEMFPQGFNVEIGDEDTEYREIFRASYNRFRMLHDRIDDITKLLKISRLLKQNLKPDAKAH